MKGKLNISRTSNNSGDPKTIHIEIIDDISRIHFVDLWMTPEDFGQAVTGLSMQPCEFRHYPAMVGKRHEVKTEIVPFEGWRVKKEQRDSKEAEALKPFEVDGWKGRREDLYNGHKRVDRAEGGQLVTFTRYVDPDQEATNGDNV